MRQLLQFCVTSCAVTLQTPSGGCWHAMCKAVIHFGAQPQGFGEFKNARPNSKPRKKCRLRRAFLSRHNRRPMGPPPALPGTLNGQQPPRKRHRRPGAPLRVPFAFRQARAPWGAPGGTAPQGALACLQANGAVCQFEHAVASWLRHGSECFGERPSLQVSAVVVGIQLVGTR